MLIETAREGRANLYQVEYEIAEDAGNIAACSSIEAKIANETREADEQHAAIDRALVALDAAAN